MKNIKIFVCTHKPDFVRNDKIYFPIQVGKAISSMDLGYISDNEGDNISAKNREYCELTAQYWAWKNLSDIDIVGFCHYRRYLDVSSNQCFYSMRTIGEENYKSLINLGKEIEEIEEILSKYDIILPKYWKTPWSVKRDFLVSICEEDFEILYQVMQKVCPEYLCTYEKVCLGNVRRGFNMFITSKVIFDEYASWLFEILFEVEKYLKLSPYLFYRRIFGFMSEILLQVYCEKNKLKIKNSLVYFIIEEPNEQSNLLQILKYNIRNTLNDLAFKYIKSLSKNEYNHKYWDNYLHMDGIKIR